IVPYGTRSIASLYILVCLQETAYCSGSGPDPCGASFCHSVLDTESRQIGIHPAARRVLEKSRAPRGPGWGLL
ncbi:MAG: hypothetical protein ABIL44_11420, partial [candidate division WOR-3 bacterium]